MGCKKSALYQYIQPPMINHPFKPHTPKMTMIGCLKIPMKFVRPLSLPTSWFSTLSLQSIWHTEKLNPGGFTRRFTTTAENDRIEFDWFLDVESLSIYAPGGDHPIMIVITLQINLALGAIRQFGLPEILTQTNMLLSRSILSTQIRTRRVFSGLFLYLLHHLHWHILGMV